MSILSLSIIVFCIMELGNILILYFKPDSKLGNGVAVFKAMISSFLIMFSLALIIHLFCNVFFIMHFSQN